MKYIYLYIALLLTSTLANSQVGLSGLTSDLLIGKWKGDNGINKAGGNVFNSRFNARYSIFESSGFGFDGVVSYEYSRLYDIDINGFGISELFKEHIFFAGGDLYANISDTFYPYLGFMLGAALQDFMGESETGYTYEIKPGLHIKITEQFFLDASYDYNYREGGGYHSFAFEAGYIISDRFLIGGKYMYTGASDEENENYRETFNLFGAKLGFLF